MKKNKQQPHCYLRLLHAFPNPLAIDVFIDEQRYAKNMLYEDFTPYYPLNESEHELTLYKHGEKEILYTQKFYVHRKRSYTLALYPTIDEQLQWLLLYEPQKVIPDDCLLARTINVCVYPMPVKLHFQDIRPEFKKLEAQHYSSYLAFPSATYHLLLIDPSSSQLCFEEKELLLKSSRYYAFYIVGGTKQYPLKVLSTIEGNSLYHFTED